MKYIIDTSSLISLVRYYLPFDKDDKLFNHIKNMVEVGQIIVIDKVVRECGYVSRGIVVNKMPFICLKKSLNTSDVVALQPKRNFNLVNNQFCRKSLLKNASVEDVVKYEQNKKRFTDIEADLSIVLLAEKLAGRNTLTPDDITVVSEETRYDSDNKYFKKIPEMCEILNISCSTVSEFLKEINPSSTFVF